MRPLATGCGGIYCEKCTHNNVELPDIEDRVRACTGCLQGETPGDRVRKIAKEMEATITQECCAVSQVRLHHGTLYGEETKSFQRSDGTRAHPAGYFELHNKSDEVIAVRVCEGTPNPFYECSRPSYITGEERVNWMDGQMYTIRNFLCILLHSIILVC